MASQALEYSAKSVLNAVYRLSAQSVARKAIKETTGLMDRAFNGILYHLIINRNNTIKTI
ncbi:hypothetical protein AGMMS50229_19260 [Campylobacterota bacterium]|nr:hypothetical protein AGMMS50229_19260 [Campylobacterota bacterium]